MQTAISAKGHRRRLSQRPPHNYLFDGICFAVALLNLANWTLCNVASENELGQAHNQNESATLAAERDGVCAANNVWSQALEDYVLSQSGSSRVSKDLQVPYMSSMGQQQPALSYHSSAYPPMQQSMQQQQAMQQQQQAMQQQQYRPGSFIVTKRIGEEMELEGHMRPPVKVVNPQFRPMTNQMLHHPQQQHIQQQQVQQQQQPSFLQQLFGLGGGSIMAPTTPAPQPPQRPVVQQQQHHAQQHLAPNTVVSENDLYMLGAIEKLVYRVDYLESRIRRAEQLLYHYFAGNTNKKEVRDACPANFTRISDNCYLINSHQQVNWKTANTACKGLSAHLAEFEQISENEEIMAHLLNQAQHRGLDYWLGGLNPGLIWIWSNSAKPVNPNMNLTSIAMSGANATVSEGHAPISNSVDKEAVVSHSVLNNTMEIQGKGRCLKLSYQQNKYVYFGQECTNRHHYICEYEDKTLDNKIKKITRDLKLFD